MPATRVCDRRRLLAPRTTKQQAVVPYRLETYFHWQHIWMIPTRPLSPPSPRGARKACDIHVDPAHWELVIRGAPLTVVGVCSEIPLLHVWGNVQGLQILQHESLRVGVFVAIRV